MSGDWSKSEQSSGRHAGAIGFVLQRWNRQDVIALFGAGEGIAQRDLIEASQFLEATYFVRLFARFEGLLESHLQTNHTAVTIPRDRKVDWLLARVQSAERFRIVPALRRRFDQVRQTRNDIAHGRSSLATTLDSALAVLSKIVHRLPDPY